MECRIMVGLERDADEIERAYGLALSKGEMTADLARRHALAYGALIRAQPVHRDCLRGPCRIVSG